MSDEMRTIEINGVKFDVDLRTAKKIEVYKVGDRVKLLLKTYSGYNVHPGAIVGIDAFQNLPTIIVAYIENVLSNEGKLSFAYLNAQTKETEICPMAEDDVIPNRETIMAYFEKAIATKQREMDDIKMRRDYFVRQYNVTFAVGAADVAIATAKPNENF